MMVIFIIIVLSLTMWSVCGLMFFIDVVSVLGDDSISDRPMQNQIVIYFIAGPIIWIIGFCVIIFTPIIKLVNKDFK